LLIECLKIVTIAIEHLYDRWSGNGFEDFILLQTEIEYIQQNVSIKEILIKEQSEDEYNISFKSLLNPESKTTINQLIVYLVGLYFGDPEKTKTQLLNYKLQNQEVESSISNTDQFNATLLIEELKPYSEDGDVVLDHDINNDVSTVREGEPYVELILSGQ